MSKLVPILRIFAILAESPLKLPSFGILFLLWDPRPFFWVNFYRLAVNSFTRDFISQNGLIDLLIDLGG